MSRNLEKLGISHLSSYAKETDYEKDSHDLQGKEKPALGFVFKKFHHAMSVPYHLIGVSTLESETRIVIPFIGGKMVLEGDNLWPLWLKINRRVTALILLRDAFDGELDPSEYLVTKMNFVPEVEA